MILVVTIAGKGGHPKICPLLGIKEKEMHLQLGHVQIASFARLPALSGWWFQTFYIHSYLEKIPIFD